MQTFENLRRVFQRKTYLTAEGKKIFVSRHVFLTTIDSFINLLGPELFFLILAHTVYKM